MARTRRALLASEKTWACMGSSLQNEAKRSGHCVRRDVRPAREICRTIVKELEDSLARELPQTLLRFSIIAFLSPVGLLINRHLIRLTYLLRHYARFVIMPFFIPTICHAASVIRERDARRKEPPNVGRFNATLLQRPALLHCSFANAPCATRRILYLSTAGGITLAFFLQSGLFKHIPTRLYLRDLTRHEFSTPLIRPLTLARRYVTGFGRFMNN